jgi:superfamily II DNA or RNA helicase
MNPTYSRGDRVRMIANPNMVGVVTGVIGVIGGEYKYEVFLQAGDTQDLSEGDIILHDVKESNPQTTLNAGRYAPIEAFKSYLTYEKLKHPLSDYLYSYKTARIEFHPHQFRPLIKFVRGIRHRLLIADEVGLGKTIEAGLIYKELKARLPLNRVLIVCPSALQTKWAYEFQTKFGEYLQVYDPSEFMKYLDNLEEPDGWNRPLHAIVSLQGVRQKHIIDRLKEVPFNLDLLIVDESHHLRNDTTDSYSLAKILCFYADAILFLTATPVNLRERDLFNQLRLLIPEEYNDYNAFIARIKPNEYILETSREISRNSSISKCIDTLKRVENTAFRPFFSSHPLYRYVLSELSDAHSLDSSAKARLLRALRELSTIGEVITRTRKREVRFETIREAQEVRVEWSEAEYTFYNKIVDFVRNEMIQRGSGGLAIAFAAINLQRMATSCLPATLNYLEEASRNGRYVFENEIDEEEYDIVEGLDYTQTQIGIDFEIPKERTTINTLLNYGQKIVRDKKFDSFMEMLIKLENSGVNKIIVFSYFLRTLSYLKERLSSKFTLWSIDGRVPISDRDSIIDKFRNCKETSILLMSEVGAEGLDFQFCYCMFNYDLPWNPMRLEQRIGRLDRFGQKNSKVLIYYFHIPQTIETRIFNRLYERIGIFKKSVGDLESILGNEVQQLHKIVLDPALSDEQRMERSETISQALEHQKNDQEEYDISSEELVAQNDMLTEELDKISQEKKYITPSELENFVHWGIRTYFNSSALKFVEGSSGTRIGVLKVQSDLLNAILAEQPLAETDKETIYRQRAIIRERSNIKVTMNSEFAFENPGLHLIAPNHIIVRAISDKIEKDEHPFWVSAIELTNTKFRKGNYLFVFFRLIQQAEVAASREQYIKISVVDINDFTPNPELSENLMAQMEKWSQSNTNWSESTLTINQCVHTAREDLEYSQRLQLDERRSRVEYRIKAQLAGIETTYERKRAILEKRINQMMQEGKLKGAELNKRQLEALYSKKEKLIRDIEGQLNISISTKPIAMGWIEVV